MSSMSTAFVQAFVSYSCSRIQRHCRESRVWGYLLAPDCDDGNTINELCPYGVSSCEICNDECEIAGVLQVCGDGEVKTLLKVAITVASSP